MENVKSSETTWLSEREQRAWRGFLRMQARLRAQMARQLQRDTGLSDADYEVLVVLSEAPDSQLRAYQLGAAVQWEKSRLSHHLSRMIERGLVARRACPTDSRGAYITLTPAGRAAIEAAAPSHVGHVRHWFVDSLTPEQLDQLAAISEAVLSRLDEEPGTGTSC